MGITFFSSKKYGSTLLKSLLSIIFFSIVFACEEVIDEELETDYETNKVLRSAKILTSNDVSVSANGDDGNVPQNTLDGNLNTRWSSRGRIGKYITYDLGSTQRIDEIKIAWFKGRERKTFFQIAVGNSTSSLNTILNRKTEGSSGTTNNLEKYQLPDTDARYLRIRVFGNSKSDWNSITEVQIITADNNSGGDNNGGNSSSSVRIPAKIQAEKFTAQSGTQNESTRDSGGGQNVGYIDNGDYLEYDIDVPNSGDYNFEFRVASISNTIKFDVLLNGNKKAGISKATTSGWQNWVTTKKTINLSSGKQKLRLKATGGGWNINWIDIKQGSSSGGNNGGNNPDVGGGPISGTPAGVLGGLRNWKLNAYSGTFRLGAKNNGLRYVDKTPDLANHSNNNWFYTDGTWTYFKAHVGNPTSSGSGNPRSELRELTADGSKNIYWNGTTNTEHRMLWKVKVDRLPQSGKVCFGQIHDKTDKFDDVIRIQCQGKGGQTSGSISMRINGYVTEVLEGGGKTVGKFNLGEEMYLELTYKNSIVKLYELNNSGARVKTIFTSKKAAAKENYFKAGAYLQSVKGKKAKDINDFGLVGIKEIKVFH